MPKLTKEDLDSPHLMEHLELYFDDKAEELLRLARLGLWAGEHKEVIQFGLEELASPGHWAYGGPATAALAKLPK